MADFAVIVPTVVGVLTLWAVVKEAWKRTLGRRGDLYRRLARLGPGAQLSFFEAIIGEPPAMKFPVEGVTFDEDEGDIVERHATFTQSLFVDPYLFLQTISDQGGTVEAFSVTTRRRWFRPTFTGLPRPPSRSRRAWLWLRYFGKPGYLFRIKLGRTTFSDIEEEPRFVRAWVTPRTAAYSEAHGGGTPTLHQTFVLTTSTAAGVAPSGPLLDVADGIGHGDWAAGGDSTPAEFKDIPSIDEFRREAVITTYTVSLIPPDMWPDTGFGPHGDEVRALP